MAIKEYVGAIIMELDGKEVEVIDIDVTESTGMKPVKVMNRSRNIGGVADVYKRQALVADYLAGAFKGGQG